MNFTCLHPQYYNLLLTSLFLGLPHLPSPFHAVFRTTWVNSYLFKHTQKKQNNNTKWELWRLPHISRALLLDLHIYTFSPSLLSCTLHIPSLPIFTLYLPVCSWRPIGFLCHSQTQIDSSHMSKCFWIDYSLCPAPLNPLSTHYMKSPIYISESCKMSTPQGSLHWLLPTLCTIPSD